LSPSPCLTRIQVLYRYRKRNCRGMRTMTIAIFRITVFALLVGAPAANAAPAVSPGDLAGRERFRFEPSPLDRFMQPNQQREPLIRWECHEPSSSRLKQRARRNKDC
jgi:hypothetical protein